MYEELTRVIRDSDQIVFFGGAGVSTESNIPDFRSQTGIYSKKTYPYQAEIMISHEFFMHHPKQFYDFYQHEMIYQDALPNDAHLALAKLEHQGKLQAVITQNIDGLHQAAGSTEVLELHGSIHRNRCMDCGKQFTLDETLALMQPVPLCNTCSGMIKPEVVLYGESLDDAVVSKAVEYIAQAEVLIIGGTSLVVYPAAGLLQYFRGKTLVLINRDQTSMDHKADIVIHDPIGQVFKEVMAGL